MSCKFLVSKLLNSNLEKKLCIKTSSYCRIPLSTVTLEVTAMHQYVHAKHIIAVR